MIEIIHEDPWLLVVNKPFGLLTQAPEGIASLQSSLEAQLWDRDRQAPRPFIGIPHRLDRVTTGIMVVARNQRALRRLCQQFAARKVQKIYRAIVAGKPPMNGRWEDRLRKIENVAKAEIVDLNDPEGRLAVLEFRSITTRDDRNGTMITEVEAAPETGRMHQIRIQFSSRGYPVLGDRLYGSAIAWNADHGVLEARDEPIALHAHQLHFHHPKTGERMEMKSPAPEFWQKVFTS